jgi:hypothetical protein
METFIAVMALMFVSLRLGDWDHKTSIGATIEYNILTNQLMKEDDMYSMLYYKSGSLDLDEKSKSRNQLSFTIRNGFWYGPGKIMYDTNDSKLYLYTQGFDGLYSQFFYDAIQIANYLEKKEITYCTRRRGIWTDEMMESEEVKSLDSKKCKEEDPHKN